MNDELIAAIETAKPDVAYEYALWHRENVARIIEKTEGQTRKISMNHPLYRGYVASAGFFFYDGNRAIGVNESWLAKKAAEYADAVAAEWLAKIDAKLGPVSEVKVSYMTGFGSFVITAKRGVHDIEIRQQRSIKISPKGLPFHQFPARLYVDGQFLSEKSYKNFFAN